MNEPVGISIGNTTLVAMRAHEPPVSCLTPPKMTAFDLDIPRLVATLAQFAHLDNLGDTIGIAVPAYWDLMMVDHLRSTLMSYLEFTTTQLPPLIITDVMATFTVLYNGQPPKNTDLLLVCDIGATASDITIIDAAHGGHALIDTVHYQQFSGNSIDRDIAYQILGHSSPNLDTHILQQCRIAKEHLTTHESATLLDHPSSPLLDRPILHHLIHPPLTDLAHFIIDLCQQKNIALSRCNGVILTGGTTLLPGLAELLGQALELPSLPVPYPRCISAMGAFLIAGGSLSALHPSDDLHVIPTPPIAHTSSLSYADPHESPHHFSLRKPWYKRWKFSK